MSFDIHLNILSPDYAWAARFDEARAILERYGAGAHEESHSYSARWDDGSGLGIYSRSLFDESGGFSALLTPLGGLSQRFCDFTYDFASAVGCAICPDVIPPPILVVHPAVIGSPLEARAKSNVIRVSSGIAVRNALGDSFNSWRALVRHTGRELNELTRVRTTRR